jgi:hypothetical protein
MENTRPKTYRMDTALACEDFVSWEHAREAGRATQNIRYVTLISVFSDNDVK